MTLKNKFLRYTGLSYLKIKILEYLEEQIIIFHNKNEDRILFYNYVVSNKLLGNEKVGIVLSAKEKKITFPKRLILEHGHDYIMVSFPTNDILKTLINDGYYLDIFNLVSKYAIDNPESVMGYFFGINEI